MTRALLGQSALYTIVNVTTRLTALFSLLILPRVLTPEQYGVFGIIIAVSALVNILLPLEISQGLARYYSHVGDSVQPRLAGTALMFTVVMLGLGGGIAQAISPRISGALFGIAGYSDIVRIAIVLWCANCLFLFFQNLFRWSFRPAGYALYSLSHAILTLAGTILGAAIWSDPLSGAVGGWTIAAIGVTAAAGLSVRPAFTFSFDRVLLAKMLKFAGPLVPGSLAIITTTYFARFALSSYTDLTTVGRFVFAAQLASIPSMVILGLQSAVTPHVMAYFDKPETPRLLGHLSEAVILTGLAGSFMLSAMVDRLLPLAGYDQYGDLGVLVALLAPAFLLQQIYIFFPGFAVAERTSRQALVSIAGGVVTVVLTFALARPFGINGAGAATLISTLTFIAAWIIFANRFYPIPVRWIAVIVLGGAMALVTMIDLGSGWETIAVKVAGILVLWLAGLRTWWPLVETFRQDRTAET